MKLKITVLAALVAVVASISISSASAALLYCDRPYASAQTQAAQYSKTAVTFSRNSEYATASAYDLLAWRTIRYATLPCSPELRTERTYALDGYADYYRADKANVAGNFQLGLGYLTRANVEFDRANSALVLATH